MLPSFGKIFGYEIYSYPLMMGLAWGIAYQWGSLYAKKIPSQMWNLFFWGLFLFSWLGAKVLFFLVSPQDQLLSNSNFWLGGGLVFYGGLLFSLPYLVLFFNFQKKCTLKDFDFLIFILPFAHGIGRLGCFLAGCCYGSYSDFFHFHHPAPLYEAIFLFYLSYLLRKKYKSGQKGERLLALYFFLYGTWRFFIEFLRADTARGFFGPFSTSQWISMFLLILSLILFLKKRRRVIHES